MTIARSRPGQALRSVSVVLALLLLARIPTIGHHFSTVLASASTNPNLAAQAKSQIVINAPDKVHAVNQAAVIVRSFGMTVRHASQGLMKASTTKARHRTTARLGSAVFAAAPAEGPDSSLSAAVPLPFKSDIVAADPAFTLATSAYARLAAGDRRAAVTLFDAAIAKGGPQASAWQAERDALTRHWSATAYSIIRSSGTTTATVTPVLGGGQSGGAVGFTLDPLAMRPVTLTLRGAVAHDDGGRAAFAALGIQWRPVPGITVAAERIAAIGSRTHGAWTGRVAAGAERTKGRLQATAYTEAGLVDHATYAAGQAALGVIFPGHDVKLIPRIGGWASIQRDHDNSLARIDFGPGVVAHTGRLTAAFDYRFRIAGNAAPGSGPVATLSAAF